MAQAPKDPGGDDAANFVRRIVSDPKNVPDVMLLNGYLGASSEEACERLYLSADLSSYAEIPAADILHRAAVSKEQDPNGAVTLWVRKDLKLQYKLAPGAQALANYFAGAIQAGAQGAAADVQTGAAATVGGCAFVATAICTLRCHTAVCTLRCATEITPCINTHANTCFCPVSHGCPSLNALCQSQGQCTFIGCGHTLACTNGLLCAAAAPAAPAPAAAAAGPAAAAGAALQPLTIGGPACGVTGPNCPINPSFVDCSFICPTRIGACLSHHFTCAAGCTHVTPCVLPTRFEPICRFPTEICTHAAACVSLVVSCNLACQPTNPAACPVVTGAACPPVSLACPQQSLACGGLPGQPGLGGQVPQARAVSLANCSEGFCTQVAVVCHHTFVTPCAM